MNKLATLQHKSLYGGKREPTQDPNHKSLPLISFPQQIPQQKNDTTDQIERDIAEVIQEKQSSNFYAHLGADNHCNIQQYNSILVHPIYRGNLVNFHSMKIPEDIDQNLGEIMLKGFIPEIWASFFCFQRSIIFWLFEPNQFQKADLNYYFNPSERQPFPSNIKVQKFQLDSTIMSITLSKKANQQFQLGNDYLLCVASQFSVSFYRIVYRNTQIEDVVFLNYQINTNGEEIYCMQILNDSLLMGGSNGKIKRIFWEDGELQRGQMGFVEVVSKQIKKLVTFTRKINRVVQIDVDNTRNLAYALVDVSDGQNLRSLVQVYELNQENTTFQQIMVIDQNEIVRRNALIVDPKALKFSYIKTINDKESDCHLLIVTINGYQILISLNEQENINPIKEGQINRKISGTFEIKSLIKSASTSQQVPIGVMAEEQRWNFKQPDTIVMDQQFIDGVYADEGILILQKSDKLFCSYPDHGQLSFQCFLKTIMTPQNANQAIQYSLYKNNSQQAIEFLQMPNHQLNNINKYQTVIASFDLNFDQINQDNQFQNDTKQQKQLQNHDSYNQSLPKIYATLSQRNIDFILHLRPIDILLQYLKVTHSSCIGKNDDLYLPLEKFIAAYGIFETASLTLQLIIQQENDFFISVDLEKELLTKVTDALSQHDRVAFNDQYFTKEELTPVWVVGNMYVLKGHFVLKKAKQFYYYLLQRDRMPEFMQQPSLREQIYFQKNDIGLQKHTTSTKVMSFITLIRRILSPIFRSKVFNIKAYNLEENRPLQEFSVESLTKIQRQINEIKNILDNDQNIFMSKGAKTLNSLDNKSNNTKQRQIIKGFNQVIFNQGAVADQQYRGINQFQQIVQDSDIENEQVFILQNQEYMDKLYKFILQVSQLMNLFILLVKDVDIRMFMKKLTEQDRELLLNITMQSIFQKNSSYLIVIKMLLSNIYKQHKDQARELNSKFNEFFDEYDFQINYAQNRIENMMIKLISDGIISTSSESIQTKLKRLLRLKNSFENITFEKIISKPQILVYYKDIPSIVVECQQISETINDLIKGVSHKHFIRAFKHLLVPLGMLDVYFRALLERAQQLDSYIIKNKQPSQTLKLLSKTVVQQENARFQNEREFLDCENSIITEFQYFCDVLMREDIEFVKIEKKQIQEMFSQLMTVFKDYNLPTIHELVIRNLYRLKLLPYIYKMQSPHISEQSFDSPLLEKFQILYTCSASRGDRLKTIEYCLKLARFSFLDQQECGFQFILQELPISKRLEFLFEAQDQLGILEKEGINDNLTSLVKEYKIKCMESTLILKLQKVVFDCLHLQYQQNDLSVLNELEQIVRYQFELQRLSDFVLTNGIYFAQLLAQDYNHALYQNEQTMLNSKMSKDQMQNQSDSTSIELIYQEMIESSSLSAQESQQQWPTDEFLNQLIYLYENLVNKEEYFSLECLIHFGEARNYQIDQESWIPTFLRDTIKIKPMMILKHYIMIFTGDSLEAVLPQDVEYKYTFVKIILNFLQQTLGDTENEIQVKQYLNQQMKSASDLQIYRIQILDFLDNHIFQMIKQSRSHSSLYQLYISVKQEFEQFVQRNI